MLPTHLGRLSWQRDRCVVPGLESGYASQLLWEAGTRTSQLPAEKRLTDVAVILDALHRVNDAECTTRRSSPHSYGGHATMARSLN